MLSEANVIVVRAVGGVVSATRAGTVVKAITTEFGGEFEAAVWVDASYEPCLQLCECVIGNVLTRDYSL